MNAQALKDSYLGSAERSYGARPALFNSEGFKVAREIPALGNESYILAHAAMSILSDFQERTGGAYGDREDAMVNAAKMLLADIVDANRAPRE